MTQKPTLTTEEYYASTEDEKLAFQLPFIEQDTNRIKEIYEIKSNFKIDLLIYGGNFL